jgi:hypothetical protein
MCFLATILFPSEETEHVIMPGRRSEKEGLYYLDIHAEEHNIRTERALVATHVEPLSLWHLNYWDYWDISTIRRFSRWLPLAV